MLKIIDDLLAEYNDYHLPYAKISRSEKAGDLIRLKRGLYTDDENSDPFVIASYLYFPSYISFETALSYHDLIPEKVTVIKSATFNKNKKKEYTNSFGHFTYEDIPAKAFPYGNETIESNGYTVTIASKEKSITDMLYKKEPCRSMKKVKELLFDDLRINEDKYETLDFDLLYHLCELYRSTNLEMLQKLLKKEGRIDD